MRPLWALGITNRKGWGDFKDIRGRMEGAGCWQGGVFDREERCGIVEAWDCVGGDGQYGMLLLFSNDGG